MYEWHDLWLLFYIGKLFKRKKKKKKWGETSNTAEKTKTKPKFSSLFYKKILVLQ